MEDISKRVAPAAGALGAYVDEDLEALAASGALNELLDAHHVLFFRDQRLDAAGFGQIAASLGTLEAHPAYPTVDGAGDVQILESTPDRPSKIELWHSDMTFRAQPPAVTLLYAQVLPDYGGDTLWASASRAYESLSEPLRGLVDVLEAEHDFAHGFQESLAEPGGRERLADAIAENPPVRHPVVRTHPRSGRRAIYVNPLFTKRIAGLNRAESDMLLGLLADHVARDEHTVRLRWQPGTIAVWDNRMTQHKPVNDFIGRHRRMYRVTVAGERPR